MMTTTISIEQIKAKQQYHLNEAKKYGELLDVALRLAKENKRADKHVDAVRERVAGKKKQKGTSDTRVAIGELLVKRNEPMTIEEVAIAVDAPGKFPKRTAGVILAGMKKHELVRRLADGSFVAKAKLVSLVSGTNGSGAEA